VALSTLQQVDGTLSASDVIVNVDTLVHPQHIQRPEEIFLESYKGFGVDGDNVGDPKENIAFRYRLKEFQPKEMAPTDVKSDETLNLGVRVHWQKWSCCTACCCSNEAECGGEGLIPENWFVAILRFVTCASQSSSSGQPPDFFSNFSTCQT
jgi:hypothetical protein